MVPCGIVDRAALWAILVHEIEWARIVCSSCGQSLILRGHLIDLVGLLLGPLLVVQLLLDLVHLRLGLLLLLLCRLLLLHQIFHLVLE